MTKYIPFFISVSLFAQTSFITQMEYASSLYKNPRGIGCNKCHGDNGEGRLIATYKYKGEEKNFIAPAINKLDFNTFYKELNKRKKAMPRYFLTKSEIQALYLYLHKNDKENPHAK
jgi:mono/diheme cytochrome c family protein